ncbi:peptidase M61 [Maribacter sp. LLG6340-A2]|uniref:M61 family metallopeptidase n=1 Tax=Maribacter sp. LLG6340-A2 TaxID=3160834 RepID=UPI00386C2F1C
MKKTFMIGVLASLLLGCGAGKGVLSNTDKPIIAVIDLVNVVDDRVKVVLAPDKFKSAEVVFQMPKTVPGTYSTDDYGKYISDFVALDYEGNEMVVEQIDVNSWRIGNGIQLDKIQYWVNDTYDSENEVKDAVFSPAGTNIAVGENFVLNLHGFVGYFKGFKEYPYHLQIKKPEALTPTTSLPVVLNNADVSLDVFEANRYFDVIDNPIMYAVPNRESFEINGINVTLSLYSPNGVYKASDLRDRMVAMMGAQKEFLGNVDATREYNILLYLSDINTPDALGFGALEHHTSTVVVLPEAMPKERLEQAMVDVVSHEFFHIVTPLSVHSKEIQFFDFNTPKMSQHLWMYEGTTEYFANLFQVQQGLITEDEFYERMLTKIENAKLYDDEMSFTIMSKNILSEPYEANYANVYEKGALINMCLDLLLREKSNGSKGVLWLMKELSKKYGVDKPFNDEDLFREIVAMTYPEVGDFFNKHVIGKSPINYSNFLSKVGLEVKDEQVPTSYFFDGQVPYIDVDVQKDSVVFIREGIALNSFFDDLKLQGGDILKMIDEQVVSVNALRPIIQESFSWSADRLIKVTVERDGEMVTVEGNVGLPYKKVKKVVSQKNIGQEIIALREAWLKGE